MLRACACAVSQNAKDELPLSSGKPLKRIGSLLDICGPQLDVDGLKSQECTSKGNINAARNCMDICWVQEDTLDQHQTDDLSQHARKPFH